MKKIDLHIHTVATESDSKEFKFDFSVLKQYVEDAGLSAIAITNHNYFDVEQYDSIAQELDIAVFPGVEINVSTPGSYCHVLVIADSQEASSFAKCVDEIAQRIDGATGHIRWGDVLSLMPQLNKYLVIPHYKKSKRIDSLTLEEIRSSSHVDALEVSNAKQWLSESPHAQESIVIFSDCRPGYKMPHHDQDDVQYAYGFTYIECDQMTIPAIKLAFANPKNVSVFQENHEFEILPEVLPVSRRINVIIGRRSSGKTYTLSRILDGYEQDDYLYIEQFEITNKAKKDEFEKLVNEEDSSYFEQYFRLLQHAIYSYWNTDYLTLETDVGNFCTELVVYANSPIDESSKRPIYKSRNYTFEQEEAQAKRDAAIRSAITTISIDKERKDLIEKYIDINQLAKLGAEIRLCMRQDLYDTLLKDRCNATLRKIKEQLAKTSARKPLPEKDALRDYFKYCYREKRLASVIDVMSLDKTLKSEDDLKYLKTRVRQSRNNVTDARNCLGTALAKGEDVKALFAKGTNGKKKLQVIRSFTEETVNLICKILFKIESSIVLNDKSGIKLSGGQRAEYLLLHKIAEAKGKALVLIDEPESSFDNPFLNKEVADLLHEISNTATVFLVTHNNTLGVSIHPDTVIYTEHSKENGYRVYSGSMTSDNLVDVSGNKVSRTQILIDSMEAGQPPYDDRRQYYGIA